MCLFPGGRRVRVVVRARRHAVELLLVRRRHQAVRALGRVGVGRVRVLVVGHAVDDGDRGVAGRARHVAGRLHAAERSLAGGGQDVVVRARRHAVELRLVGGGHRARRALARRRDGRRADDGRGRLPVLELDLQAAYRDAGREVAPRLRRHLAPGVLAEHAPCGRRARRIVGHVRGEVPVCHVVPSSLMRTMRSRRLRRRTPRRR